MATIELEIIGTVSLGGKMPGDKFRVPVGDDGRPTDLYWRRRLADEERYQCGAVRVVTPPPPAEPAPEPAVVSSASLFATAAPAAPKPKKA